MTPALALLATLLVAVATDQNRFASAYTQEGGAYRFPTGSNVLHRAKYGDSRVDVATEADLRAAAANRSPMCDSQCAAIANAAIGGTHLDVPPPSATAALPLVFFGWWLYMTELRQFHGFQGFSFDFPQCYNATPSHEHHEL